MEAVSDLKGIGSPLTCPRGVVSAPVATNNLDAWMRFEPTRQGLCRAVGEQIHWLVALQVDQDRAVAPPTAKGEIIHPQHTGRWTGRSTIGAQTRQDDSGRCRHPQRLQNASSAYATRGKAHDREPVLQPQCAPRIGGCDARKPLSEDVAVAGERIAEELAHMQAQAIRSPA